MSELIEQLPEAMSTERLRLRRLQVRDAEALFVARGDPEVCRYWSTPPHESVSDTRAELERFSSGGGAVSWAITTPPDDEALGWVTLIDVRPGVAELGYILRRALWGKGYAREAVQAMMHEVFSRGLIHRLAADMDPRNRASVKLVERLGFEREGLLRENWLVANERCDSVIYALLDRDYRLRT